MPKMQNKIVSVDPEGWGAMVGLYLASSLLY